MCSSKSTPAWKCPDCGATDASLCYPSGKIKKCMDCQRFYNISVNASRPRKRVRQPQLKITKPEFLKWAQSTERKCRYCGISERDLVTLGQKTQIGLAVVALGIDRVDGSKDYEAGNIDFCCFACNKVKGNVFDDEEMKILGKSVAEVWKQRMQNSPGSP